jgi:hypothetical protein
MTNPTSSNALNDAVRQLEAGVAPRDVALSNLLEICQSQEKQYNFEADIVFAVLDLLEKQKLTVEELNPINDVLLDRAREAIAAAAEMQKTEGGPEWLWDSDYSLLRAYADIYLALLGYLRKSAAVPKLRSALTLRDPWLKAESIVSLLRHHEAVDDDEIENAAANHEGRLPLWRGLRNLKLESLMPARWAKPEELAASALAEWCRNPREHSAAPEEIELMSTFPKDFNGVKLDVYLFRYRLYPKPWEEDGGWIAAIGGPIHNGEEVGRPWSSWQSWNAMSPREHFQMMFNRECARDYK